MSAQFEFTNHPNRSTTHVQCAKACVSENEVAHVIDGIARDAIVRDLEAGLSEMAS
jgi:hypothetical protein